MSSGEVDPRNIGQEEYDRRKGRLGDTLQREVRKIREKMIKGAEREP